MNDEQLYSMPQLFGEGSAPLTLDEVRWNDLPIESLIDEGVPQEVAKIGGEIDTDLGGEEEKQVFFDEEVSWFQEHEKKRVFAKHFTPEHWKRYSAYTHVSFPRVAIKKAMQGASQKRLMGVPPVVVMSGLAKIFAADLIEMALQVQLERGDTGPLLPPHIHEAHRRLSHTPQGPPGPRLPPGRLAILH
ncbi:putative transcription initiation factor TFIID subunit 11 [Paratrimastix pyriformis]|uniref:Transcription initiation factor TFIID subunit 11 n=1 Tax=Paratrimastix pyriformis TaxID=342808 RepID=A0ABQ8UVN0_9EUKA|nr:putative transcription initiation factor TFIID subunit 11 [Paratrimastix pyriformis]